MVPGFIISKSMPVPRGEESRLNQIQLTKSQKLNDDPPQGRCGDPGDTHNAPHEGHGSSPEFRRHVPSYVGHPADPPNRYEHSHNDGYQQELPGSGGKGAAKGAEYQPQRSDKKEILFTDFSADLSAREVEDQMSDASSGGYQADHGYIGSQLLGPKRVERQGQ
jgi:hypothetical protein